MTTARLTNLLLTIIAVLLAAIAWTLQSYRPVVSGDFDALLKIQDHDDRQAAIEALLRRRHVIYVHDGHLTVGRIDDPVQVEIQP